MWPPFLDQTLVLEWPMELGILLRWEKQDMQYNKIGLCAQNLSTILGSKLRAHVII